MNARAEEQPVIETVKGVSSTEYRARGSLQAVFRFIEATFKARHPMGYGTMVHTITMADDGSYVARVSHSNSCD